MANKDNIVIKRVYDVPTKDDGYRILVDRLWPRGVKKADLPYDEWNKEITPSTELRKWFNHKAECFDEFAKKYEEELEQHNESLENIRLIAKKHKITLLYAAKDPKLNQAVILKNVLNRKL